MKGVVCLALVLLAGCDRQRAAERTVPVRIEFGDASANSTQIADPPAAASILPAVWSYGLSSHTARYGPPDAASLLAISCEGWEEHAGRLVIVRYVAADKGAEALFAIQGSKGIVRLPVSAVPLRPRGYAWRGVLDAADPRVEVLLGNGLKATVPGGGELDLPQMGAAGAVVSECVLRKAREERMPLAQTLPNLASNPETSPADR